MIKHDCHRCEHATPAIGSGHHLTCHKPDPEIKGNAHGITKGWFFYPFNYDPMWIINTCRNYSPTNPTAKELEAIKKMELEETENDKGSRLRLESLDADVTAIMEKHELKENGLAAMFFVVDMRNQQSLICGNGGAKLYHDIGQYLIRRYGDNNE